MWFYHRIHEPLGRGIKFSSAWVTCWLMISSRIILANILENITIHCGSFRNIISIHNPIQWIGLWEDLQEDPILKNGISPWFPVQIFPDFPIHFFLFFSPIVSLFSWKRQTFLLKIFPARILMASLLRPLFAAELLRPRPGLSERRDLRFSDHLGAPP